MICHQSDCRIDQDSGRPGFVVVHNKASQSLLLNRANIQKNSVLTGILSHQNMKIGKVYQVGYVSKFCILDYSFHSCSSTVSTSTFSPSF